MGLWRAWGTQLARLCLLPRIRNPSGRVPESLPRPRLSGRVRASRSLPFSLLGLPTRLLTDPPPRLRSQSGWNVAFERERVSIDAPGHRPGFPRAAPAGDYEV